MKCSIISDAGLAIKYHCSSERYLALEIETLSLMDGYPVQPVPWRQGVNVRDSGGLKSQFMRSAKRPVRDGTVNSPQVSSRPSVRMKPRWKKTHAIVLPQRYGGVGSVNKSFNSCKRLSW
jgi:hypothetical protein